MNNTLYLVTVVGATNLDYTTILNSLKRFGDVVQDNGAFYLWTTNAVQDIHRAISGITGGSGNLVVAPLDASAINAAPYVTESMKAFFARQSRAA